MVARVGLAFTAALVATAANAPVLRAESRPPYGGVVIASLPSEPVDLDPVKADSAAQQLKAILETDPPYGARVTYTSGHAGTGWHSPQNAHWLEKAINDSSRTHYGKPAMWMGEGGTIPFMAMLGVKYPQAQFLITGVLGPHSNAHGPNEFLHIDYAKRLTACVADVLAAHASKT